MHKTYSNPHSRQLLPAKNIIEIALALTAETSIKRLLEMILNEALRISTADAGTLYIINEQATHLDFAIVRNQTLGIETGFGKDMGAFPSVPLYTSSGEPNLSNISSCAALTRQTINIDDVYDSTQFNFSGTRVYDEKTGYRSESMLVIPMYNHEDDIIGVLQLLNAMNPETGQVVSFDSELTSVVRALASLAAAALNNRELIAGLKNLFYSFIKSIAAAVDEKSPYTGGHIKRVVELALLIADEINARETDPLARVKFNDDEREALKIAAWMHDIGKITTPEYVVNKSSKLETIRDGIQVVRLRFKLAEQELETRFLRKKMELSGSGRYPDPDLIHQLEQELKNKKEQLESDFAFICECNKGKAFMEDSDIQRLEEISQHRVSPNHDPFLTPDELENLSIKRGKLTRDEREIIENHVVVTRKILNELPFPKNLQQVPDIAASHHEKLDGSGYPDGKESGEIGLGPRILAIADIFEALTAPDRPYKCPITLSKALHILDLMEKDGHIDKDIVRLFKESRLFVPYAEQYLKPEQMDL